MDYDNSNYPEKRPYLIIGGTIVGVGLIVLFLSKKYIDAHFPILGILWPVIMLVMLLFVAVKSHNQVIGLSVAFLGLIAVGSYASGNNLFRQLIGLVLIGMGLLLLYYILAQVFLHRK